MFVEKICVVCGISKVFSDYPNHKEGKVDQVTECKACKNRGLKSSKTLFKEHNSDKRVCTSCGICKCRSKFGFHRRSKTNPEKIYYKSKCKDCVNLRCRERKKIDIEYKERRQLCSNRASLSSYYKNQKLIAKQRKDKRNLDIETFRKKRRNYCANNKELVIASHNRRRARKMNAQGAFTAKQFKMLCQCYENCCVKCGRNSIKLTADHVIPLSKGGNNYISNIQPLCKSCNSSKGTKNTDYRKDFYCGVVDITIPGI